MATAAAVAVVMTVVLVAVAVVMVVTKTMVVTVYVYGPLVNTIMVRMKMMNAAIFVVLRLTCTYKYDVGRYVLLVLYLRYLVIQYKQEMIRFVRRVPAIGMIPLNNVSYVSPYTNN